MRAAGDPLVHVVVHVPLEIPHAVPGVTRAWYCTPGRAHVDRPIPEALLRSYEELLAQHGPVVDHFGLGSWEISTARRSGFAVVWDLDDHLEVVTRLSAARAFVPALLRDLRSETDQQEALGEIMGVAYGDAGQRRTRIMVRLPTRRAGVAAIVALHRIFGNRGNGGASQYADENGVHVYSGVAPADVPRIEAALRRAGFAYTTEPETFVTVDAPAC